MAATTSIYPTKDFIASKYFAYAYKRTKLHNIFELTNNGAKLLFRQQEKMGAKRGKGRRKMVCKCDRQSVHTPYYKKTKVCPEGQTLLLSK
jgi:hypothetical protein